MPSCEYVPETYKVCVASGGTALRDLPGTFQETGADDTRRGMEDFANVSSMPKFLLVELPR